MPQMRTKRYLESHSIPDFPANHFVYAFTRLKDSTTGNVLSRVIRFTESNDKAADQKILLDNIPAANGLRFAGALAFGPDDKLYVTVVIRAKSKKAKMEISRARFYELIEMVPSLKITQFQIRPYTHKDTVTCSASPLTGLQELE